MKTRNYKMDLALMAYPNELTPDIDTDYIVKVNTQSQSLTLEEIAADVAARSGKFEASEVKSLLRWASKPWRKRWQAAIASPPPLLRAPHGERRGDGRGTLASGRPGEGESLRQL